MKRFTTILTLAAVALAAVALAACGDDDDGGGGNGGGDRLTEEAYFTRLTEINQGVDADFTEVDEATHDSARAYIDAIAGVIDNGVSQLEGLNPPESLEADHDELLDALHGAQAALDDAGGGYSDDDPPELVEEELFAEGSPLEEPFLAVDAKFCELQETADAQGIAADVGCD